VTTASDDGGPLCRKNPGILMSKSVLFSDDAKGGQITCLDVGFEPQSRPPNRKEPPQATPSSAQCPGARGQRLCDRGRAAWRRLVGGPGVVIPGVNPQAPRCSPRRHSCRRNNPMLLMGTSLREENIPQRFLVPSFFFLVSLTVTPF
jgi:hypothetical protein